MAKIGVQVMMLKTSFEEVGPFETLRKVSEIGYNAVEISQISMSPENVAEMARARDELGMDIASLSAGLEPMPGRGGEALTTDFDKIVADCTTLGSENLRIGMLPFSAMASLETALEFCRTSNEVAGRLAEHGVNLYYHNHHIEFARFDGIPLLDIINENAPNMRLELDVHWVQRGGNDPVTALKKYADRTDLVHLKDYRIGQLPPEAFDSLAKGDFAAFMNAFTGVVQFAEVGEGNLDFKSIIDQAVSAGVKYLFVEQDDPYGRDPFDCLITSRENLLALGFSDLF